MLAALAGNLAVAVTLDFHNDLPGGTIEAAADGLTDRIQRAWPEVTRVFLRPARRRLREVAA